VADAVGRNLWTPFDSTMVPNRYVMCKPWDVRNGKPNSQSHIKRMRGAYLKQLTPKMQSRRCIWMMTFFIWQWRQGGWKSSSTAYSRRYFGGGSKVLNIMDNEYDAEMKSSIPIAFFARVLALLVIEFAGAVAAAPHLVIQFSSSSSSLMPFGKIPHYHLSLIQIHLWPIMRMSPLLWSPLKAWTTTTILPAEHEGIKEKMGWRQSNISVIGLVNVLDFSEEWLQKLFQLHVTYRGPRSTKDNRKSTQIKQCQTPWTAWIWFCVLLCSIGKQIPAFWQC